MSSGLRPGRSPAGHGRAEFGPRGHAELAVDAGEVGFHGPGAQEQRGGDLPVGLAGRGQDGDALLGRGQLERRRRAKPDAGQLRAGARRPPRGGQGLEDAQGIVQVLPGDPLALSSALTCPLTSRVRACSKGIARC